MANNPLLCPVNQPIDYAQVQPDHIVQAIPVLIDDARRATDEAARSDLPCSWDAIIEPLQDKTEALWRAWSVAGHLNAVVNTPELRAAYNQCLPQVTEFATWVGLHEAIPAIQTVEGPVRPVLCLRFANASLTLPCAISALVG